MNFINKLFFSLLTICIPEVTVYAQDIIAPGAKPAVFAPGVISTPVGEFAPTFTSDGKTVYFSGDLDRIYFSKQVNGKWAKPHVASFSGKWKDMDPFISPDGKRLFFSSYRPLTGSAQDTNRKYAHIWYVDRLSGDIWSAPHHLEAPVNLEGINNYVPTVSKSGTLYFFSPSRDSRYKRKSYYAKWLGDHYDEPKPLLVSDAEVKDPSVSANESYLVFANGHDIYVSYRTADSWSTGQKVGPQVNNGAWNGAPYISADGKMLYYSSDKVHGIQMISISLPKNIH